MFLLDQTDEPWRRRFFSQVYFAAGCHSEAEWSPFMQRWEVSVTFRCLPHLWITKLLLKPIVVCFRKCGHTVIFICPPCSFFFCRLSLIFVLSGLIQEWSWCCGDPHKILSARSWRTPYRSSANNRPPVGSSQLHVHHRPPTAPPAPPQKHTFPYLLFLNPKHQKRTWKCKKNT